MTSKGAEFSLVANVHHQGNIIFVRTDGMIAPINTSIVSNDRPQVL